MFTKDQLQAQLKAMGLRPSDTVMIHTAFRAVGPVEGGPTGFLDAFCEYFSEGLFLVPTHTWASVGEKQPVYDVRAAIPCIGAVPRAAAFRSDGIRSLHPSHSVWAHGNAAADFVKGEENAGSPAPPGFCWDRLGDMGAKILLIGVGHDRNTFIHSIDERAGLPDRLSDPFDVTIIDHDGNRLPRTLRRHKCARVPDPSRFYVNFEKPLAELGAQTLGVLGNATVRIVDAKRCREIILRIYERAEEDYFTDFCELPEELYRNA